MTTTPDTATTTITEYIVAVLRPDVSGPLYIGDPDLVTAGAPNAPVIYHPLTSVRQDARLHPDYETAFNAVRYVVAREHEYGRPTPTVEFHPVQRTVRYY